MSLRPLWFWTSATVLVVAALFLLLTGGGGSTDGDLAIAASINRMFTTADPSICDDLMTDRWLADNFDSSATQTPLESCHLVNDHAVKAATADILDLQVTGNSATATVHTSGGDTGEATIQLALLNADGWRADHLLGIDIDPKRFFTAKQTNAVEHAPTDIRYRGCLYDWAATHVTSAEFERSVLAGNEDFLFGGWSTCKREFEASIFSPEVVRSTGAGDLTEAESECISERVGHLISPRVMHEFFETSFDSTPPPQEALVARDAAIAQCT